jgi:hypothetical protein
MSNLDRYLSEHALLRSDMVLLVIVSFFVAAKLEETLHAKPEDLAKAADSHVSPLDVILAEVQFVQGLGFHIWIPTAKVCKAYRRII